MTQPNILMIMPDQMRGDCLSLDGHPVLETPVMDSIGRNGTYFTKAYTTCPSCIPARRALLTGLFPASNGMVGYREGLPITTPTLPQMVSDAGYATAIAGRYMHQSPREEAYGFQTRVLGSTYIRDDDYAQFLDEQQPELGGIRGIGISCNGRETTHWPTDEALHPTNWTVTQARRLLSQHDSDNPIFHVTSFYAPHPPLFPPKHYMDDYLDHELPPLAIGAWDTPPPEAVYENNVDSPRVRLQGEELRQVQAGYYGLIRHIDDQIRDLVADFKAKSEAMNRPWIIVLTSDHGEMLGDHYYFRKCEPYEGSSRIPFLIQGSPELGFKPGSRCDTPVCLEDLMPTVLELAGIEVPDHMDGQSLVAILRGTASGVRDWLHTEHAPCYSPEQGFHMLTNGQWKYIWRPHTGQEQLFDLDDDPGELADLIDSGTHQGLIGDIRRKMIDQLNDRPEGFVHSNRLVSGRPYPAILTPIT